MPRIRTIKPAFFRSRDIVGLSFSARLTFIGLWTYVDDSGRGVDDPLLVKAEVWPLDVGYTVKKVASDLNALENQGLIERYEVETRRYLRVLTWGKHQKINHPSSSPHPPSPSESSSQTGELPEDSRNLTGSVPEPSPENHVGSGSGSGSGSGIRNKEVEVDRGSLPAGSRNGQAREPQRSSNGKPSSGPLPSHILDARKAVDLADAEACGKCDQGWVHTGGGEVLRCEHVKTA